MNRFQQQFDNILKTRAARLPEMDRAREAWQMRRHKVEETLAMVEAAEHVNPDIQGCAARLRGVADGMRNILIQYEIARSRFERKTICIGIGGAARMGKSTFLQAVTGLDETQIPTSDKYYTTAGRSQIENSTDNIAVADFHSKESFVSDVIAPMCKALGIWAPFSFDDFRKSDFRLPDGVTPNQEQRDVLQRLRDAQEQLPVYEKYLTGERKKRIPLEELRPFVAYPLPKDGKSVKAGPYLAVADLTIRVPFPSTDVSQLRVVDLPGLGEAGLDLATVQTKGLEDVCDVTLLMKRPQDALIQWSDIDSKALDAMGKSVPLFQDQTKYTAILANVGSESPERADGCVASIKANLDRPFQIIRCNAIDRASVLGQTMPEILDFIVTNLPEIDNAIMRRLTENAEKTLAGLKAEVGAVRQAVCAAAPLSVGAIDFATTLFERTVEALTEQDRRSTERAAGLDKEWNDEVERIHKEVETWVKNGCGYGSHEALVETVRKEIMINKGQPNAVINDCRNKFRREWEAMDLHLEKRIAELLGGAMDALQGILHGFVPDRNEEGENKLAAVRRQILTFAARVESRYTDPGDELALCELSGPLRRIAEFDLQFRFHLEPLLHATTNLLVANELPLVKDESDAATFTDALTKKLVEAAEAYASGMRKSGSGNTAELEKKKRLLEKAIKDESARKDILALLDNAMGSAQSFCPNRIFAAVMETFADAFIRSKESRKAFQILAREWRNELEVAPDEKTRLTNAAAGALVELAKMA